MFWTPAPVQSAAGASYSVTVSSFFPCMPSYSALIFEAFAVIDVSVFAGLLHLLTADSRQLVYSLPVCSALGGWVMDFSF